MNKYEIAKKLFLKVTVMRIVDQSCSAFSSYSQFNTIVTLMVADYSSIAQTLKTKYLLPQAAVAVKMQSLHTLTNYRFLG